MRICGELVESLEQGSNVKRTLLDWQRSDETVYRRVANAIATTSENLNPALIEPAIKKYRLKIQSKLKVLEKLTGCKGLSNTP